MQPIKPDRNLGDTLDRFRFLYLYIVETLKLNDVVPVHSRVIPRTDASNQGLAQND